MNAEDARIRGLQMKPLTEFEHGWTCRSRRGQGCKTCGDTGKLHELPEWVFSSEMGTPLDMHNLKNRPFKKALEKAGLRRIRMHDLRHSYASILIAAGVSPAYVEQQLGHASIKLTVDTYTHLIPGAGRFQEHH